MVQASRPRTDDTTASPCRHHFDVASVSVQRGKDWFYPGKCRLCGLEKEFPVVSQRPIADIWIEAKKRRIGNHEADYIRRRIEEDPTLHLVEDLRDLGTTR